MRQWRNLLGGLLLWAAHFFALYIIASILPGTDVAAMLALAVTFVALSLILLSAIRAFQHAKNAQDSLDRWMNSLSMFGYVLAFVAILYQGLPALLI